MEMSYAKNKHLEHTAKEMNLPYSWNVLGCRMYVRFRDDRQRQDFEQRIHSYFHLEAQNGGTTKVSD